ncbi:MAG: HAMP domain-containing histidine kinase [Desulfobacterales bacterium]|nr:HAMP domain-containing histidine kinase [Desulfobacterales bacterium]MBT7697312.1 HAMP domain-containing histidine kinase [Desulfobacterales bacterium]
MKRLKLYILVFFVSISIPLAWFVLRTYQSLDQEEMAALRYFADTLFYEMEKELEYIVVKEEGRAVDEYNYYYSPTGNNNVKNTRSPLSDAPDILYILGYIQNNPDGSFHTPMVENLDNTPTDIKDIVSRLKNINNVFNIKRTVSYEREDTREASIPKSVSEKVQKLPEKKSSWFGEKYLDFSRSRKSKDKLGQEEKRVERVTKDQALNISQYKMPTAPSQVMAAKDADEEVTATGNEYSGISDLNSYDKKVDAGKGNDGTNKDNYQTGYVKEEAKSIVLPNKKDYQAELAPMQSVFITDDEVFIFRRVVINKRIYRQGFVLVVSKFMKYLVDSHFKDQPMARFAGLSLKANNRNSMIKDIHSGADNFKPKFILDRIFPHPFSFLQGTLACENVPRSEGRKTLNIMMIVTAFVILLGLYAIYRSASVEVELSERRQTFVSSVTHELKTPLTNIRMYIEMIEQGVARDMEREQEYFRIIGSESSRLSRLINNVLEFSKLEKNQRIFDLQEGDFNEVVKEVKDVMQEKIRQEGFIFKVNKKYTGVFKYDREVMIQVLINLIENSMKFGKGAPVRKITLTVMKERNSMKISLSDTGQGIPAFALQKVFGDFYRVDNSLTRTTGGTGIGLSLVKKFITSTGGSVHASNNNGAGCTITIALPV